MKRKGITAKLVKPSTRYVGLLMDEEQAHEQQVQWAQQDMEQMERLREQYGIPDIPSKWYRLALEMAREIYPKPLKRGPKTKWNEYVCGILVVEVDRLVAANKGKPGKGLSWALKTIGKQPRWATFVSKRGGIGRSTEPGIEWYYDHNKASRKTKVMRDAFRYYRETNTLDEWEQLVDEFLANPLVDDAFPD